MHAARGFVRVLFIAYMHSPADLRDARVAADLRVAASRVDGMLRCSAQGLTLTP